jgi:Gas vesicle synthesis protein GvpO
MAESNENGRLSAAELGEAALVTVKQLTGYEPEAVTGLEWDGEYWRITVDALELERIPSTTDVIGQYVVQLDDKGTLRGYKRTRRFVRAHGTEEE